MAYQLVYTSAAKLLDAGRSGFGTVARAKAISPLLVSAIERVSQFANLRGNDRSRVIYVHRRIIAANNRVHVLSRICDAGADYTGRTNHIAHHLIISQEEVARAGARGLTPADVLRQFLWLGSWEGSARFFSATEDVPLEQFQPQGRQSARSQWARITGNPAHARILAWDGAPRTGVLLMPRGADALGLLAEALHEFGAQSWSRSFTTSLETTDELSDLDWIVASPENFSEIQGRCGSRAMLDLSQPQSLPLPPEPVQKTPEPEPQAIASPVAPSARNQNPVASRTSITPVVSVHVRDGSSGGGPKRMPAPVSGKQRAQLVVGLVVFVMALGILGVAVWKAVNPKAADNSAKREVPTKDKAKKSIEEMGKFGFSEKEAQTLAETAGPNIEAWSGFAINFINYIKGDLSTVTLANLPENITAPPLANPEWISSLTNARRAIFDYFNKVNEQELDERVKLIRAVLDPLQKASNKLSNKDFKKCGDQFVSSLVTKEVKNLIVKNQSLVIPDKVMEQLKKLSDLLDNVDKDAAKTVMKVMEYVKNPDKPWNQDDEEILKSSVVPIEYVRNLKGRKPASSGLGGPLDDVSKPTVKESKAGPNLSGVKENEVILVTEDQLKKGVKVELLNRVLTSYFEKFEKEIEVSGFGLRVVPDDPANKKQKLYISDANTFYCWTRQENTPAPKFGKDKFSFSKDGLSSIEFTYKGGNLPLRSLLVIEKKDGDPIGTATFDFREIGPDEIAIVGEILDKIKYVINADGVSMEEKLIISFDTPTSCHISKSGENVVVNRTAQTIPPVFLSEQDKEKISISYKECEEKDKLSRTPGGTNEDKKTREDIKKKAFEKLEDSIKVALEGAILANLLKLDDESKIDKEIHKQDARKLFKDFGAEPWDDKSDWVLEFKKIKDVVGGGERLGKVEKQIGIEGWGKNISNGKLEDAFRAKEDIIKKTSKPLPRPSLMSSMNELRNLEVSSPSGRILYRATRKD
ncbi:MAG: hypothetical protein ABI600_16590 [Luteolibacter sp.]